MSFLFGTGRYSPKLELLSQSNWNLTFRLTSADLSFANSIRRIIISDVPTMAIEQVVVKENTSPLFDEFICHRLGLIPLISETAEKYNYSRDCNCESKCSKCSVEYRIKKFCNTEKMDVTTEDIELINSDRNIKIEVQPVKYDPPIVIAKLAKNQKIDMYLTARKGIGKAHAKWSPVCCCVLQQVPNITFYERGAKLNLLNSKQRKNFVDSCPSKVFRIDEETQEIVVSDSNKCTYCEECMNKYSEMQDEMKQKNDKYEKIRTQDAFKIEPKKNEFVFKIEGTGSLKPKTILTQAFELLEKKLRELVDEVDNCIKNNPE